MPQHVLKKGLDIPIAGAAIGDVIQLDPASTAAYAPTEFRGMTPRMKVKVGDALKVGSILFADKTHSEMVFRSPLAGRLAEVRRGARRVITDVVVERDGDGTESLPRFTLEQLAKLGRDEARSAVLGSGMWAALRTRPLDRVADPTTVPQAILLCASETGPLQPGPDVLLGADDGEALQAAVHALRALTDGKVYLTSTKGGGVPATNELVGVEAHEFSGPHPAGDAAVQVNLVAPPTGGGSVWTIRAWDALALGRTLLDGAFFAERIYAAVGKGCATPRRVRTVLGAPMAEVVGSTQSGEVRWIRGSVLTGEAADSGRWASFYARAVHVLPEEVPRRLFGWAMPSFGTWSFHKAYLSGFSGGGSPQDLRPGIFGGHRAIVPIGVYGKVVVTPDILPQFLFKSIAAGDLEEALSLGLLDLTEEEAALCTYICPSKIGFDDLLREGLDAYEREA
jgi:Na+-transporting NADH:ubiquinone oxidoreductase subunit A